MKYISKGMVEHGSTGASSQSAAGRIYVPAHRQPGRDCGSTAGLALPNRMTRTPGTGGNWSICAVSVWQNLPKRVRRENTVP